MKILKRLNGLSHTTKVRLIYLFVISLAIGIISLVMFFAFRSIRTSEQVYYPTMQPEIALRALATPTPVYVPTPTPSPSLDWKVTAVLNSVKINGYTYAVIEFTNLGTGETKTGQCQQPAWPMPEIGHIYTLKNTAGDIWLFIPQEGVESHLQRFAPIE